MTRLIRSELLKLRTTNMWWIFLLTSLVFTGLAIWINIEQTDSELTNNYTAYPHGDPPPGMTEDQRAEFEANQRQFQQEEEARVAKAHAAGQLAKYAANIYTSGQFFGLLLVMLLAILVITNEFYHQTATATFLATPKRTRVIAAKLITASLAGVLFWLITTAISIGVGVLYFGAEGLTNSLGHWTAQQAVLLNLLVYVLWAVFGIGVGVLIRSQIGATITAAVLYTVGTWAAVLFLTLIHELVIKKDWVLESAVYIPPLASSHVVGGLATQLGDTDLPPRWAGALVLIVWAVGLGTIGTLITRKRDIA
ncbi:ABC transporter permease [Dactylosporangium aurantiacum]|uniref:ABC transporter permease n=1 Tax=Dactylosporangium aurantiacum TaxID=35754 RepID=A0A9Q9IIZ1_9ACTN|nr:ABC transporter permease subunit [Dactylosporangium aurantiacum]MDG6104806.1 ABC transporter permease subunit [Dactylosporangium aurantiacum]UWZ55638.1 ABC transporter permease [Dactylosporangium aurantiacum]